MKRATFDELHQLTVLLCLNRSHTSSVIHVSASPQHEWFNPGLASCLQVGLTALIAIEALLLIGLPKGQATRDKRTVKFFTLSPILIQNIKADPVVNCKNFWINRSDPVLSTHLKLCIFIFPLEAKALLELFWLYTNIIGWRQISSSCVFSPWGKIDEAFWHFQNLTSQCSFCHQKQKHCCNYFAIRWTQLVELVKWQWRYTWISV